jgi:hypothetical protein
MATYRYVLQGCNDANVAAAEAAARTRISEIELGIEKSSKGYYFISVTSDADHDSTRAALADALRPLRITVAIVKEWTPTGFADFS